MLFNTSTTCIDALFLSESTASLGGSGNSGWDDFPIMIKRHN